MGGWFQDELERAITIATASIQVYCKFAITSSITDLIDDKHGNPNASIALRGFYCVFIFKTDEDRTLFKLTVNNTRDFKQRVLEVLHES